MQQATVNLFADMGLQPHSLLAGLLPAAASTDTLAPTSSITAPAAGAAFVDGATVTVTGTASDSGGGVVASVEVSTDAGATWHRATGTTNWTYTWTGAHGYPAATIRSRASDDSANLESAASGTVVGVNCPCSFMGTTTAPAVPDSTDVQSTEVGAKFTSDINGTITGMRFYKAAANTGTHTGNVWSASGQRLATATFTNETSSGWQTVTFGQPLAITAGTPYIVSYFAPQGHYSQDTGYFYGSPAPNPTTNSRVNSPPLRFNRTTVSNPNGYYSYSSTSTFPDENYQSEYYWVDVIFNPVVSASPAVTSTTPANNATGRPIATAPTATFNQSVTASSVNFTLKDAAGPRSRKHSYAAATNTSTFTPAAPLAYSTSYTATSPGPPTPPAKPWPHPTSGPSPPRHHRRHRR